MMEYDLYLFDFDYTLANSEKGILECFYGVLVPNGYLNVEEDAIKRTIGMHLKDAFASLTGVSSPDELQRLADEFFEVANRVMTAGTTFFPSVRPLLTKLKANGKKVGIISTKRRYRINEAIEKFGYGELFDVVIGVEDVETFKPSPEGVLKAIELFGTTREKTLYVGDSLIDMQTAMNAEVDFVAVTTGTTERKDFLPYPHKKIIEDLQELI